MPLIRDYVAEHDHVLNLLDAALRAIGGEDLEAAASRVREARETLGRHWTGEENGIFKVMAAREEEYADYVAPLVVEHRELEQLLLQLDVEDPADQQSLRVAYADLREHISREEDGLFPASLTALSADDWNESISAWQEAHPGESMLTD